MAESYIVQESNFAGTSGTIAWRNKWSNLFVIRRDNDLVLSFHRPKSDNPNDLETGNTIRFTPSQIETLIKQFYKIYKEIERDAENT